MKVGSSGLGRTTSNQAGGWQLDLGGAFKRVTHRTGWQQQPWLDHFQKGWRLSTRFRMTFVIRILSYGWTKGKINITERMCCRQIRVTCRWGILPITWGAGLGGSSALGRYNAGYQLWLHFIWFRQFNKSYMIFYFV